MYTREQLALRAQQTVEKMQATLDAERLVARFVDAYVAAFGRKGLKASPLRYRELLSTIGREAWLVLAARMSAALPEHLAPGKRILRAADAEALDGFREAFFAALAAALRWTPAELEEFRRDLALYLQIAARQPQRMKARSAGQPARWMAGQPAEGPFVDRCALLLDPSLLDKARQAAGQFQAELEEAAERILQSVFRPTRKPR